MSMSEIIRKENSSAWKSQAYIKGVAAGALLGLVAAYMYSRAAEEDAQRNGGAPNSVSTGEVIGLGLAALAMVRQIAEMGKGPAKKR
jgi:hypothetical protein